MLQQKKSMSSLIGEVLNDGQKLVGQEIELLKAELHEEWEKTRTKTIYLTLSGIFIIFSGVFFLQMGAYFLFERVAYPLWVCYGLVAAPNACLAIIFYWFSRREINHAQ